MDETNNEISQNKSNEKDTSTTTKVDKGTQDYQKYFNMIDPGYMRKFDLVSKVD